MNKGLYIVFEGIDGSGKDTQCELLHQYWINTMGHSIATVTEPSQGIIGRAIRDLIKDNPFQQREDGNSLHNSMIQYLFAADRIWLAYHDQGIKHLLEQGTTVISNRNYISSFAYNSDSPEDFELIQSINSRAILPNIIFYLDVTVENAIKRIEDRNKQTQKQIDIYEKFDRLNIISNHYNQILNSLRVQGMEIHSIDTNIRSVKETHQSICNLLQDFIEQHTPILESQL